MADLSKVEPERRKPRKKLEPASLERFIPSDDQELGIGASNISGEARKRHYARYTRIAAMLSGFVKPKDMVCDVGCGSGYGSRLLRDHFYRVVGVEPNDLARQYAAKHHPNLLFANDYEGAEVCVFVESLEHMTPGDFTGYIGKAHTIGVTTPIVAHPYNDYHEMPFKKVSELHNFMLRHGFAVADCIVQTGITFTTGEFGDQLLAVYRRVAE